MDHELERLQGARSAFPVGVGVEDVLAEIDERPDRIGPAIEDGVVEGFDGDPAARFGAERPPDGEYVLRIVADPNNHIFESEGKTDPARESQEANEYVLVLAFNNQRAQAVSQQDDLWAALLRFLLPVTRLGISE